MGYNLTLSRGVKYILDNNFKYLITFDADNQHKSEYLEDFINLITSNKYGLVIGNRNKFNRISDNNKIKTTLNEFVAYPALAALESGELSERSKLITFYSLCGFANLSSVGILISGITAMAPERKDDLIKVSFKALVGATLASCMTGLIVGIFI